MGVFERLRSAKCSTGRFSVSLIFRPENIASISPRRSAIGHKACKSFIVSAVARFLE